MRSSPRRSALLFAVLHGASLWIASWHPESSGGAGHPDCPSCDGSAGTFADVDPAGVHAPGSSPLSPDQPPAPDTAPGSDHDPGRCLCCQLRGVLQTQLPALAADDPAGSLLRLDDRPPPSEGRTPRAIRSLRTVRARAPPAAA